MVSLSFKFLSSIVYIYATCSTPEAAHYCSLSAKNEAVHSACPVKYDELLQAGYDFVELVAVHGSSMELVEIAALMDDRELPPGAKLELMGGGCPTSSRLI